MLRRLHPHQPASFAFTPANQAWAQGQVSKYPPGRQASAIIPLLWRAQEQEGWLSRPAIEHVATMLGMPFIRALEVATFYFMFQLAPVGRLAHVQICGTTPCMLQGAEGLVAVCQRRIAARPHALSADGALSWEEVECLGACTNAPMAQIGKDYYEDLTPARLEALLDALAAGRVPEPGPQNGRFSSEPLGGGAALTGGEREEARNGSVARALAVGDTVKRIDGTEVPLSTPWIAGSARPRRADGKPVSPYLGKAPLAKDPAPEPGADASAGATGATGAGPGEASAPPAARPEAAPAAPAIGAPVLAAPVLAAPVLAAPGALTQARGVPDDLKVIKGVGPKLEAMLHRMGIFHFDQIAAWTERDLAWVDANLDGFKGRASRDGWIAQARIYAAGLIPPGN